MKKQFNKFVNSFLYTCNDIKDWFRNCCNKHHFNTVWATFKAQPYDYYYTNDIMRARLVEILEYFKRTDVISENNKNRVISKITLAISLLDISMGNTDDYMWKDSNASDTDPNAIYVNTKNAYRYYSLRDDSDKVYLQNLFKAFPSMLREEKATKLFWRVMYQYSIDWWD